MRRPLAQSEAAGGTLADVVSRVLWIACPLVVVPAFGSPYLAGKRIVFDLGVALCGILYFSVASHRLVRVPRTWIAFTFLLLCGLIVSTAHARSASIALPAIALYLAWTLWVLFRLDSDDDAALVADAVWIGVIQVLIGIVQIAHAAPAAGSIFLAGKQSFIGTLGNSDFVAAWLSVALLLAAYGGERFPFKGPALVVLGIGILLAGSRGAWLGLLVAIAAAESRRLRRLPPAARLGVVALAVTLLSLLVAAALRGELPAEITDPHTIRGRIFIWAGALHLLKSVPFAGVGLEHFQYRFFDVQARLFGTGAWDAYAANASRVTRVHNEPIDFWVEGGFFFAAAWSLLFAGAWASSAFGNDEPPVRAARIALVYVAVVSLVSFPLHVPPNLMMAGLLAARLLAPGGPRSGEPAAWTWRSIGLLLCAGIAIVEVRQAVGQWYLGSAVRASDNADRADALRFADRSLHWSGFQYDAGFIEARSLYRLGRLPESRAMLSKLESVGRTLDMVKLEGLVLGELHDAPAAESVYRSWSAAFPLQITPHYQLGRLLRAEGRAEEARAEFETAIRLNPTSRRSRLEQERSRALLDDLEADADAAARPDEYRDRP